MLFDLRIHNTAKGSGTVVGNSGQQVERCLETLAGIMIVATHGAPVGRMRAAVVIVAAVPVHMHIRLERCSVCHLGRYGIFRVHGSSTAGDRDYDAVCHSALGGAGGNPVLGGQLSARRVPAHGDTVQFNRVL